MVNDQKSATPSVFNLNGRVCLVTAGGHGLGYAMAKGLAEAGASLVLTSRSLDKAQRAAADLETSHGVKTLGLSLDHCDPRDVEVCFQAAHDWMGRLDVVVNNAGGGAVGGATNFFQRSIEDIKEMISVNLTGVIFCCQAGGRLMAAQGHGKIINISSVAALVGRNRKLYEATGLAEQAVDYAAAKAGLLGLTRDLAAFLAPHNIQVNAISPGGFRKNQSEAFIQGYSDLTMQGRMGESQSDLTGAVVFLASPASAHVTAQNLVVDGGFQYFR
jgi:NAD(P)-dependent dehydrogenase (short-subunit alcohol dehydrogenase family)